MNRELRFRVWDGKKFHHPEATKDEANHYLQFGSGGFWLFNENGKMITASEVGGICDQFTGLIDKNGKEIYEGDILQDVDKNRFEVIFYYGQFKAAAFPRKIRLYNIITPLSEPVFEVIGDIHQNPELLKLDL